MAQVTKTVCDVFGTSKDITLVHITIKYPGDETNYHAACDLSPRAIARLKRFIERGLVSAAKWKERDDAK